MSAIDINVPENSKNWGWKFTVYPLFMTPVADHFVLPHPPGFEKQRDLALEVEKKFWYSISVLRLLEIVHPRFWIYHFRDLFRELVHFLVARDETEEGRRIGIPYHWKLAIVTLAKRLLVSWINFVEVTLNQATIDPE
jgi:hypothetical protein